MGVSTQWTGSPQSIAWLFEMLMQSSFPLSHCSRSVSGALAGGTWIWWPRRQRRMPTRHRWMAKACRWHRLKRTWEITPCSMSAPVMRSRYGWSEGHLESPTIQVGRNDFYKVRGAIRDWWLIEETIKPIQYRRPQPHTRKQRLLASTCRSS